MYKYFLRISPEEALFHQRNFYPAERDVQHHLERIGIVFIEGFQTAIAESCKFETLLPRLEEVESEYRGFAYEGAAMGLALLDSVTPWNKRRFQYFLDSEASAHAYMIHVGAGWAWARLHRDFERGLTNLDPLLGWLVVDGYGFHQGYFCWPQFVKKQIIPKGLSTFARKVFDQGLGRSLWFVEGADPDRIAVTIQSFKESRRSDLWSGIGLASAYAGGVDRSTLESLRTLAAHYQAHVAQGVAFAAKARQRAGNPSSKTMLACEIFCGLTPSQTAQITDLALENLPFDGSEPVYGVWRKRIQAYFASTFSENSLQGQEPIGVRGAGI